MDHGMNSASVQTTISGNLAPPIETEDRPGVISSSRHSLAEPDSQIPGSSTESDSIDSGAPSENGKAVVVGAYTRSQPMSDFPTSTQVSTSSAPPLSAEEPTPENVSLSSQPTPSVSEAAEEPFDFNLEWILEREEAET